MSSYFNMIPTCPESSNIINKAVDLGDLPILSNHILFHGTRFSKCWASWRFLILAAINSFASLPQVFPIAPRDILGINWSLLLSCLLGFKIYICLCILLVQMIWAFFFFLVGVAVLDGKTELGGQIGGFEEILAVTSSPAFPDTIQTRDTKNVC